MSLVSSLPKFQGSGAGPDFIVWTGDNARHDSDHLMPRTAADIYSANSKVASMLSSLGVPLVPSIGNNDVYPHDQLCMGPNDVNIANLSAIWAPFIPSDQQSTFKQLGCYTRRISSTLWVISVNSMVMYKKNKCGSGCHSGDNGDYVLSWINEQLKLAQASGATVYLTGHVPPVADFWHNKCLEKYSDLASKYSGTVAAHLYAHTHQDNYAFLHDLNTGNAVAVVNIAPSGVSTYNPSVRQYSYNVASGVITDYVQFFANLTNINTPPHMLAWHKEYSWREAYGYSAWTLNNWIDLDQRIAAQPTVSYQYLTYRYVSSGLTQFMACSQAAADAGLCVLHLDKYGGL